MAGLAAALPGRAHTISPASSGAAAMAEAAGPFHRLQAGSCRYLCYCRPGGSVYVTDALEVWTGELSARPSLGCRCQPEEHGAKLREALGRGAASLSPGERPGTLRLRGGAACSALELCPLPAAEARSQLRALLFGMAGHIESLERRLSVVETLASSCSPEKSTTQSQQQFLPDPKPGKNRGAGSTLPARRKIPGESLINPGFKSKKAPSGVDFEDS
uniref:PAXX non-homologous end joining factor n=1 Tax=Strigops habroptila TaxID=2489341 RepID=A0A672UEL3_STRHB